MTEEESKQKGFKVDDRRRFSAEGELKPEHQGAPDAQDATSQASLGAEKNSQAAAAQSAATAERTPRSSATTKAAEPPEPEINFAAFVVSLSTEALALLGEISDPASGERHRDLKAAQQIIDIIGMLRDKTRGNLNRDEEQLVDAILFDLRMKYVEIARQPAGR